MYTQYILIVKLKDLHANGNLKHQEILLFYSICIEQYQKNLQVITHNIFFM
jgi:hypothetical protein